VQRLAGGRREPRRLAWPSQHRQRFLDNFADLTADDLPTNIRGVRGLVRAFPAKPLPPDDVETLLCAGMTVPARIRANLGARQIDGDDVLRTLEVPLLVTQGRADTVVLPAMAEHVLATCPTAEPSWYDGVGHTAHLEQPERFNRALARLTAAPAPPRTPRPEPPKASSA
jgi:pimeloyl-ACP methyl ester carboxylesterase